jgi:chromosome segregation ATPase
VIQKSTKTIQDNLNRKAEGLPLLRQKAQEAMQLLEVVQKAADQKKKIAELREKLVWACVEEKEKELELLMERIERIRIKRERLEEKVATSLEMQEGYENTITELEKRKNETTDREAPLVAQIKDLKEQEKVFGTQIKNCRDEESTLNEQYKRLKAQLKGVEKRIDEENRKLRDGNQEKRSALLRQQKQAELEKRKMEKDEADQRDKILELEHKMAGFEHDRSRLQGEQDRLRKEVANSEGMMRTFQTTQRNQMTAYGPNIPALLAAIDQERGWRQKPVGPIGRHLKLKDVRWAGVLESVLGNTLNAFCVTNIHDRNLLQQLARRSRCDNIPILTGSDEAFDYSRGEPEADVQTILRVLDIETPFLTRQLINSVQIEQSALVEARAQGDELMRQNRRNVKLCYSMDMYRLGGGRGVGSSTITLVSHRGAPRLTTDIESRMRDLQATHQKDQAALRIVDRELDNLQQEWRELNEEKVQCRQRIPILQRQARDRHSEMERLDEDLREDEPTNIGALVEAKKDFETEMAKVPDQLQKVYERIDGLEKEIKPISERRLAIRLQIEEMQKQSRELQPRMEKAATDRLKAHNDMLHWRNELTKLRPNEDGLQASVSICEKELERRTEAAEGHCERVTAGKDVKHYEKQIEVAEQQLQIAAKRHGISIEAITTQVKQYSEAFEKARVEIVAMKEVLTMLNSAVATRLEKWRRWRRIIAVRAKNLFSNNLSRRGYSGSLTFDHENQKLTLTVRTEEALNGHQDKDPKSLSGGEKSFATICLLLALWESIGCPIRCLDEFDVFMDAVNRQISMSMMVRKIYWT